MSFDQIDKYTTVAMHALLVLMVVVPIAGNLLASALRAAGKPDLARKVDAWIPLALGAMREAKQLGEIGKMVSDMKTEKKDPPDGPAAGSGGVRAALTVFGMLLLAGCASPLRSAAEVANYGAQAGAEGQTMVHDECTAPMQALASEPPSPERAEKAKALAKDCDGIEESYDQFRRAHLGLVAAILSAQTGHGISVDDLLAITDEVAQSLASLEKSLRAHNLEGASK